MQTDGGSRNRDGSGPNGTGPRGMASGRWPGRVTAGICLLASTILVAAPLTSQSVPLLTGSVEIHLEGGGISGDVCLAGAPTAGDSVTIVLHNSLSILDIRGAPPTPVAVQIEPGGATVRYSFAHLSSRIGPGGAPVADLCLTYEGHQPVYAIDEGEYRDEDASNVIAFNGTTLRARGAARWYPAPYDARVGIAAEAVAYDLEITCPLCETIYVNGGDPLPGPSARFRSAEARELLLVAGRLPVTERPAGRIIGEYVAPDTADLFFAKLADLQAFLASYVGVPYRRTLDIVRIAPVREPRRGQIWGFFSDPALTLIGMDPGGFVRALDGPNGSARRSLTAFLSHELAHRYFGWSFGIASPQRDLFSEPFATYLEIKAVRHYLGDDEYRTSLRRLLGIVSRSSEHRHLVDSTPEDYSVNAYRYGYAPLMLFALEWVIGEDAMRETLRRMIESPADQRALADVEFMGRKAREAGVSAERWRYFLDVCQATPVAANPCLEWITEGGNL